MTAWIDSDSNYEDNKNEETTNLCILIGYPSNASSNKSEKAKERAKRVKEFVTELPRHEFESLYFKQTTLISISFQKRSY